MNRSTFSRCSSIRTAQLSSIRTQFELNSNAIRTQSTQRKPKVKAPNERANRSQKIDEPKLKLSFANQFERANLRKRKRKPRCSSRLSEPSCELLGSIRKLSPISNHHHYCYYYHLCRFCVISFACAIQSSLRLKALQPFGALIDARDIICIFLGRPEVAKGRR